MTRVLLIKPPSIVKYNTLPIGLLCLASYLRKEGHEAFLLDARIENIGFEQIKNFVEKVKPDIVGVSLMTYEARYGHVIAKIAKQCSKKCKVVFGGPLANSLPAEILQDNNVDAVICNEGEITMNEICNGVELSKVNGVYWRNQNGKVIANPEREFIEDLDSMPLPAYDLVLDLDKYFNKVVVHGHIHASSRIASIFTSRGCPFNCVYCHKIMGRKFRARSPENVLEEIRLLYDKYGIREIHIEDDSFNIDRERAKKIMDLIAESGMKLFIQFPNGIRADFVDEELMKKFKKAGVYRIAYGIETASPEMQKYINKNLSLEKVVTAVNLSRKYGIIAHGFFMLGFPEETREQMQATIDFATKLDLCTADFAKVVPFPGTKLYDTLREKEIKPETDANKIQMYNKELNLSKVSIEEMNKIHKRAYMKFYANPKRFWAIISTAPKNWVLKEFIKSFYRFLKFIAKPNFIGIDRKVEKRLEEFASKNLDRIEHDKPACA